jgi:hypothetical protein
LTNYKRRYNSCYRKYYLNISQPGGRRLPSGFTERSTWRVLKKAWTGFKIAKAKGDHEKMIYYAQGIQKFQKQLNAPLYSFSDLGIAEQTNGDEAQEYTPPKSNLSNN